MTKKQNILIVEDEESILLAMSDYLGNLGYQVHEARVLEEAERLLSAHEFAAVISDLRLTGSGANEGLELASKIAQQWPGTETILLSAYGSAEVERAARAQGVAAFLHKPKPLAELAQIVFSVLSEPSGEPKASSSGSGTAPAPPPTVPAHAFSRFSLTAEELQVARLVGEGQSNAEIARSLGISEQQVHAHRDTLAVRLDPRSRFELALYLVRHETEG